jgi:hypothetical protein
MLTIALDVIRAHYLIHLLNGIVGLPTTNSGHLVKSLVRQIASQLHIEYLTVLTKERQTQEQKYVTNRAQKAENVKRVNKCQKPSLT